MINGYVENVYSWFPTCLFLGLTCYLFRWCNSHEYVDTVDIGRFYATHDRSVCIVRLWMYLLCVAILEMGILPLSINELVLSFLPMVIGLIFRDFFRMLFRAATIAFVFTICSLYLMFKVTPMYTG